MVSIALFLSSALAGSLFAPSGDAKRQPSALVSVSRYSTGHKDLDLHGITLGTDGAIWYTETYEAQLQRMTTSGQTTTYPLAVKIGSQTVPVHPGAIATGADGKLYFGGQELVRHIIGALSASSGLSLYTVPGGDGPGTGGQLTLGPGGLIWYSANAHIGSISPSGVIKQYKVAAQFGPLTTGPDGNLWFATTGFGAVLGTLNPATGAIKTYPIALQGCYSPESLVSWNGSLVLACAGAGLDLISTTGSQTPFAGLLVEPAIQVTLAPPTGLPLVTVGETLAAFDPVHVNFVNALLPSGTYLGPMTFGSDGRIWSLDRPNGTVDAVKLNGNLSSDSSVSWQQFPLPSGTFSTQDLEIGSDGAAWVSNPHNDVMYRIDASGNVTTHKLAITISGQKFGFSPANFALGSDGNFYVDGKLLRADEIGVVTPSGTLTAVYPVSGGPGQRGALALGPDGNVWFTGDGDVGKITTAGVVTTFPVEYEYFGPIVGGRDGSVWATAASGSSTYIDKIDPATGYVTPYSVDACYNAVALAALAGHVDVTCPDGRALYTISISPNGTKVLYYGIAGESMSVVPTGEALLGLNPGGLGELFGTAGEFIQYPSPYASGGVRKIAVDPSGAVWAMDQGAVDRLTLH